MALLEIAPICRIDEFGTHPQMVTASPSKELRARRSHSRAALVAKIERTAISRRMSIAAAIRHVVSEEANWELLATSVGPNSRKSSPSTRTVRRWLDRDKVKLGKAWPNISSTKMSSEEAFKLLEAYIPLKRRHVSKSKAQNKVDAAKLLEQGKSRGAIAEALKISRTTIYRWLPLSSPGEAST